MQRLRDEGYDVRAVSEERPRSLDTLVLAMAREEQRVLLTNDKDFAALTFLQHGTSSGIVLLRMPRLSSARKAERLVQVLAERLAQLPLALTVVWAGGTRLRALPRPRDDRG